MTKQETRTPTETTRHALVIRVPRELENRLEDIYLNLAGTTKPVMGYHVTLLGPFSLVRGRDDLDHSQIEAVCRVREPFVVELEGLHVSAEPNSNAILVDIVGPQEIIGLHDDLLAALGDQITFTTERARRWNLCNYRPHVTVALGLSDKELAAFPVERSARQCHASFQVTSVSLAADNPSEPWRHLKSFHLGAGPHPSGEAKAPPQVGPSLDGASYS